MKNKYLILSVIFIILFANLCSADVFSEYKVKKQVKYGIISFNEIWDGEVYIIGDVVIPGGVTVTVARGTKLKFADYDIFKAGKDTSKCEIIVYGVFDLKSGEQKPIKIESINNGDLKTLSIDKDTQVIKFYPYKIETENLRKEFRSFKIKYIILWSLIYTLRALR